MAKNKHTPPQKLNARQKKQAEAEAQAREEKRRENSAKSARLGNAYLLTFLSILALYSLYMVVRAFLLPAKSVSTLRADLLFVSLLGIPYLIMAAAFLVRKLRRKQRQDASSRVRVASGLIYFLVLLLAAGLCAAQLFGGRVDASKTADYSRLTAVSEQTGLALTEPESVPAFKSLLEYSQETSLTYGQTTVLLNLHNGSGFLADRFEAQARRDYAAFSAQEKRVGEAAVTLWPPAAGSESPRSALCVRQGSRIVILELTGPEDQIAALLPALELAAVG